MIFQKQFILIFLLSYSNARKFDNSFFIMSKISFAKLKVDIPFCSDSNNSTSCIQNVTVTKVLLVKPIVENKINKTDFTQVSFQIKENGSLTSFEGAGLLNNRLQTLNISEVLVKIEWKCEVSFIGNKCNEIDGGCPEGLEGDRCEKTIDVCAGNKCANSGTCNASTTSKSKYACKCRQGFKGDLCEQDVDECLSNACPNVVQPVCINTLGSFNCVPDCTSTTVAPTTLATTTVMPGFMQSLQWPLPDYGTFFLVLIQSLLIIVLVIVLLVTNLRCCSKKRGMWRPKSYLDDSLLDSEIQARPRKDRLELDSVYGRKPLSGDIVDQLDNGRKPSLTPVYDINELEPSPGAHDYELNDDTEFNHGTSTFGRH